MQSEFKLKYNSKWGSAEEDIYVDGVYTSMHHKHIFSLHYILSTLCCWCIGFQSNWKPIAKPRRAKPKTYRQAPTHWLKFYEEAVFESEARTAVVQLKSEA